MGSFNYKRYIIPHMIDTFTTVTKLLKINKLHVSPLNIPKFEPQRVIFIGKGSPINYIHLEAENAMDG